MQTPATAAAPASRFAELYTPKLVTVLREGYSLAKLRADAVAGLTVAIVALPLSMALAIASGVTPDRGLYTAIVGGFFVSLLGGSRFQIGGPAGAFIVLVAGTVAVHGIDGLILATFLSGLILLAAGYLRLGTYIKYIPYPVTVGFTSGIAAIVFASQLKDLFGLTLTGPEPSALVPKLHAIAAALPSFNGAAVGVAAASIATIVVIRRFRPGWPSLLIGVVLGSVLAALLQLPVETIGTRYGGIPRSLPLPQLPDLSLARIVLLLPVALSFALLGCIESLLSAVVADSMSGRRHRSNCELVAQGVANMASSLFGGFCVTGTIARTATNVRAGAHGPVAGMLHALFLLAFILIAAPLASYVPLAALAALLITVAWNMAEKHSFATLLRGSRGDAVVLLATFGLTVFRSLMEGIVVGFALAALLFLHRMSESVAVEAEEAPFATDKDIVVYRISGAFFFGAAATVAAALDRIAAHPNAYVIDFSAVAIIDSTAAITIEGFMRKARKLNAAVYISGAGGDVRDELLRHGVREPQVSFRDDIQAAIAAARAGAG
ncbi:MAG TPA: SulP family inorganic anion transporter [Steroidobacteraceae bacterium]|jgi:SulP family sulfate permease|nr:SulP family inorganic anion transporter [Steroidobacteraceae bacterium]